MQGTNYEKIRLQLRAWLQGRAEADPTFYIPLNALNFIERNGYDQGFRKDGKTPAFQHQLEIAQAIRAQARNLLFPAQTIAAALLHDVMEDFDVEYATLVAEVGTQVADAVWKLTKKFKGMNKPYTEYFRELATCPIASPVKLEDRPNNLQSMLGVFTLEKQKEYMAEVIDWFLPLAKAARRRFPQQEPFYECAKRILHTQLELLTAVHEAKGK